MPDDPSAIVVKFVGRGTKLFGARLWLRQFPGENPRWGKCRFKFDPAAAEYDWLVVYDDLPPLGDERFSARREVLPCPRQHTMLVTSEPVSIKVYGSAYLRQFGHVLSSQEPEVIRHPGHIHSQCGLRWFYGRGNSHLESLDDMEASPPLAKTALISTVCSSKQQRHTLHRARYLFTGKLKTLLPELHVFGHGVRDMDDKAEALDAYRYHVAVENHVGLHHWTEKLADAFLGGTLPFYHGCPNASDYFPADSYIPIDINNPEEAARIIRNAIATNQYEKRLPFILEARRRVLREHNLFSLLPRLIEARHQPEAHMPAGGILLSRRQARRANPLLSMADLGHKIRLRFRGLFARANADIVRK